MILGCEVCFDVHRWSLFEIFFTVRTLYNFTFSGLLVIIFTPFFRSSCENCDKERQNLYSRSQGTFPSIWSTDFPSPYLPGHMYVYTLSTPCTQLQPLLKCSSGYNNVQLLYFENIEFTNWFDQCVVHCVISLFLKLAQISWSTKKAYNPSDILETAISFDDDSFNP